MLPGDDANAIISHSLALFFLLVYVEAQHETAQHDGWIPFHAVFWSYPVVGVGEVHGGDAEVMDKGSIITACST